MLKIVHRLRDQLTGVELDGASVRFRPRVFRVCEIDDVAHPTGVDDVIMTEEMPSLHVDISGTVGPFAKRAAAGELGDEGTERGRVDSVSESAELRGLFAFDVGQIRGLVDLEQVCLFEVRPKRFLGLSLTSTRGATGRARYRAGSPASKAEVDRGMGT